MIRRTPDSLQQDQEEDMDDSMLVLLGLKVNSQSSSEWAFATVIFRKRVYVVCVGPPRHTPNQRKTYQYAPLILLANHPCWVAYNVKTGMDQLADEEDNDKEEEER